MEAQAIERMRAAGVEISPPEPGASTPAVIRRIRDEPADRLPEGEALIGRPVREAERTGRKAWCTGAVRALSSFPKRPAPTC